MLSAFLFYLPFFLQELDKQLAKLEKRKESQSTGSAKMELVSFVSSLFLEKPALKQTRSCSVVVPIILLLVQQN